MAKLSENLAMVKTKNISAADRADLVAFLRTLTDRNAPTGIKSKSF
jgi:hypothetical protein